MFFSFMLVRIKEKNIEQDLGMVEKRQKKRKKTGKRTLSFVRERERVKQTDRQTETEGD